MLAMIFKGDEELNLFPKVLRSGFLNELEKKSPYLLLQTDFSCSSSAAVAALTSQVGCCNINEKIMKLEQCFDEATIALIGI